MRKRPRAEFCLHLKHREAFLLFTLAVVCVSQEEGAQKGEPTEKAEYFSPLHSTATREKLLAENKSNAAWFKNLMRLNFLKPTLVYYDGGTSINKLHTGLLQFISIQKINSAILLIKL